MMSAPGTPKSGWPLPRLNSQSEADSPIPVVRDLDDPEQQRELWDVLSALRRAGSRRATEVTGTSRQLCSWLLLERERERG